ncbi:MAG TPA: hypothetical protein VGU20_20695 [Stellaceae bacterium]|nr:hypothetical protein [Stellaceae bacterium]
MAEGRKKPRLRPTDAQSVVEFAARLCLAFLRAGRAGLQAAEGRMELLQLLLQERDLLGVEPLLCGSDLRRRLQFADKAEQVLVGHSIPLRLSGRLPFDGLTYALVSIA